jgi:hypothetical protein
MIRILNLVTLSLTIAICFGLYRVTNDTRAAQAELERVNSRIETERETMDVLKAEWSVLVQPARLQELSEKHLALQAVSATQISSIERIPFRADSPQVASAPEAPAISVTLASVTPRRNPLRMEVASTR